MVSFLRQSSASILATLVLASISTTPPSVDAKNAHFTMEFIPTFKNGLPHRCHPDEITIMEKFLGDLLSRETGMAEHSAEYHDQLYEPQEHHSAINRHHFLKVRGFDFSMECPSTAEACGDSDWCHVLCLDESVRPGHESLTEMANSLKDKLHSESKTLEGPFNIKCLGHTEQLDFHLQVSVSP